MSIEKLMAIHIKDSAPIEKGCVEKAIESKAARVRLQREEIKQKMEALRNG